jgi:hypothetical protein
MVRGEDSALTVVPKPGPEQSAALFAPISMQGDDALGSITVTGSKDEQKTLDPSTCEFILRATKATPTVPNTGSYGSRRTGSQYLRAGLSITSMGSRTITALRIWQRCLDMSIIRILERLLNHTKRGFVA